MRPTWRWRRGADAAKIVHGFHLDPTSVAVAELAIGPIRDGDRLVSLRPPRLTDGPAWSATSRSNSEWLRDSFTTPGLTWEQSTSLTAWADRLAHQRSAVADGLLVPYVVADDQGRIAGEISFAIDRRTATAEVSLWLARDTPRSVRTWAIGMALVRIFDLPQTIQRVIAPVAVVNPGPVRTFERLGFTRHATSRELRPYGDQLVDHDIWWLDRDDDLVHLVRRMMTSSVDAATPLAPAPGGGRLRMVVPRLKVVLRGLRRRRDPAPRPTIRRVGRTAVRLTLGRTSRVRIDGRDVGLIDVRHDQGSSTLEAWSQVADLDAARTVGAALIGLALESGAHRVAWSVEPGSPEHRMAKIAGLSREGTITAPLDVPADTFELWAAVIDAPVVDAA